MTEAEASSDAPAAEEWTRRDTIGCALYLLLFCLFLAAFLSEEISFDPGKRCAPRESGACLSTVTARVESVDSDGYEVRVRYDDARRTATALTDDRVELEPGSRVRLEWWDGYLIALYDPSVERRYRTDDWPDQFAWSRLPLDVFVAAFASLFAGTMVVFAGVALLLAGSALLWTVRAARRGFASAGTPARGSVRRRRRTGSRSARGAG